MRGKKLFGLLMLGVVLLAAIAVACAGAANESMTSSSRASEEMAMEAPAAPMEADMAYDTAGEMETMEEGSGGFTTANTANAGTVLQQDRLIIRNADLQLIVSDTDEALQTISKMAEENGGWVVSSNVFQYDENAKTGSITIRVPSSGFNSALDALQAMAVEVQSISTSGQDVTEEYVDLEARLGNLEATADRVRSFLDDANRVEDALAVNQELSRLEGEIESIKGRMQYLSQSASFSTITVQLTPDVLSQPIETGGWQANEVVREAVESLIDAMQGLASFAIWFVIYVLPLAVLVLIPAWFIFRLARRFWRRSRSTPEPSTD